MNTVDSALKIAAMLDKLPDEIARRAINMVWFERVGRDMDWSGSAYRRKQRCGRPRSAALVPLAGREDGDGR